MGALGLSWSWGLSAWARTGGALLYDEQRVQGLSRWPDVVHEHLLDACPGGVLVIRLGPGEEPTSTWTWKRRAEEFGTQTSSGFAAWLQVSAHLSSGWSMPANGVACSRDGGS